MNNVFIHPQAIVESNDIGSDTRIWAFTHILDGAKIGINCNIGEGCYVENGVVIGDNVVIKNQVSIWDGITVEDNVFLGPNVALTNDPAPRAKQFLDKPVKTRIKLGASIGASATIICGITIGNYAMIGAGAVVTKDVPPFALVVGNPGRVVGKVDEKGNRIN